VNQKATKARFTVASKHVVKFLGALAGDLRFVGMRPRQFRHNSSVKLTFEPRKFATAEYTLIGNRIRQRQLWEHRNAVYTFENSPLKALFINGDEIDLDRIHPKVELCQSDVDFTIHQYCRLRQSVPSGSRVGRRIAALVYDIGQNRRVLMGAIMLASPLYSVRARDAYLEWNSKKAIKDAGLRRMMDLSLCMALPPYNELLVGKLVATLAVSKTMAREFSRRYDDNLLAVTTTSATGLHCPIFNRIMIAPGGLYRRIGETTGYTTILFSEATLRSAREVIRAHNLGHGKEVTTWNTIRILKTALRHCGIDPEPLLQAGNHKGVYIAMLDTRSRDRLRAGHPVLRSRLIATEDAIAFWRSHLLPRRVRNSEIIKSIRKYRFHSIQTELQVG
jgi:hypothetical protein